MTAVRQQAPRTPPRFLVRTFWLLHRTAYRLTGGRFGLTRPEAGSKFGMLRLTTVGRRSGQPRVAIIGYYEDVGGLAWISHIVVDLAFGHGLRTPDGRRREWWPSR